MNLIWAFVILSFVVCLAALVAGLVHYFGKKQCDPL